MQFATFRSILVLLIILLLAAACQTAPIPTLMPTPTDPPEFDLGAPATPVDIEAPAAAPAPMDDTELVALNIAAEALSVDADAVSIVSVEAVDWNDSSLGCPQPDMMYAQVITPGYRVTVDVDGEQYEVHMDESGFGVVCGQ